MASIIKTDNIQKVSDDSNIIKKCGSTITVGSSGCYCSFSLWCNTQQVDLVKNISSSNAIFGTTAKTGVLPFTATTGKGFFVNTTSGAITVTLPASPSAGDVVALKDYASTWSSNNVTVCRNSSKINGSLFKCNFKYKVLNQ